MTTRENIVAVARGLLGTRFAHQGRNEADGLDCLGLLLAVAEKAGVTLEAQAPSAFDRRDYGTRPDTDLLRTRLGTLLRSVAITDIQPADILLLRVQGRAQHLALVTDYPVAGMRAMLHAYAPARKVVEHRLDGMWRGAIDSAYRLPLFED